MRAVAHAAEREVRAEGALLGREAGSARRALEALRERCERRIGLEADRDDARAAQRGEGDERPEPQLERARAGERLGHARGERRDRALLGLAEEAQRHVEALRPRPAHLAAAHLARQSLGDGGGRAARAVTDLDREEGAQRRHRRALQRVATGASPRRWRRMQSSAICAVSWRWRSRSSGKSSSCATLPCGDAKPTKTSPTGFSALPPSGPAMPVVETREIGAEPHARALGHRARHRLRHGSVSLQQIRRHAEQRLLRLVRVGDDSALVVARRAGHGGEHRADEPAGAGLGDRDAEPARREQRTHDLLHRLLARAVDERAEPLADRVAHASRAAPPPPPPSRRARPGAGSCRGTRCGSRARRRPRAPRRAAPRRGSTRRARTCARAPRASRRRCARCAADAARCAAAPARPSSSSARAARPACRRRERGPRPAPRPPRAGSPAQCRPGSRAPRRRRGTRPAWRCSRPSRGRRARRTRGSRRARARAARARGRTSAPAPRW